MMLVRVAPCVTVIVGCSASVTPPATAVRILDPATDDWNRNLACPFPSVVAEAGSIELPSPDAASVTVM